MSRLEDELRNAMRCEEPPNDFAERILAAAEAQKQRKKLPVLSWRGFRWAVAAAAFLAIMIGGLEYRRAKEERARGEAAKEQLMLVLRIAGSKLQFAQAKVQQNSGSGMYRSQTREN
jgi:hypothetical protein